MFRKKKTNNAPAQQDGQQAAAPLSKKQLNKEASQFIQSAKAFEQSEIERIRKFAKIAWGAAGVCLLVTGLAVGAVAALSPLKVAYPFVLRVDNNTGMTDIVSVMKEREDSYGEVVDKFWLAKYVRDREGYDWYTIQTGYDSAMLMSGAEEQNKLAQLFELPEAPYKILKNNFRVEIEIGSVAFIGNETAQVRFTKRVKPLTEGVSIPAPQKYIATIAYEYKSAPQDEQDRLINPLGFQVLSYRADPEAVE